MAKKYNLHFSLESLSPFKAYFLGLMWADGWITSNGNGCALSSNDSEIEIINNILYPEKNHPIETRPSGCKIIHICNKNLVNQLKNFGFVSDKSKNGVPIIPLEYEKYWMLGLLDGDGCIYQKDGKCLRVFFSGNEQTLLLVQDYFRNNFSIEFIKKLANRKNGQIDKRILPNNNICYQLQTKGYKDAQIIIEHLYSGAIENHIPFYRRKYQKYIDFINARKGMNECKLCHEDFIRNGSTQKYCKECSALLIKLRNRQQYEYNNYGFMMDLQFLLKPDDKQIDLIELSTL